MKKIFRPMDIGHGEDRLRVEFFGDHPWELARPRVILEDGGNDSVDYNWSHIKQPGKRLDGERYLYYLPTRLCITHLIIWNSVIQRQLYLMNVEGLHKELAYDVARKEFYQYRHLEEVERRIAKEEALSTGAYFGKGPNEISLQLEDQIWEHWKTWAFEQVEKEKQRNASAYSGTDSEEAELADPLLEPGLLEAELEEMSEAVPATKEGQDALGGAPVHP
jgi:small subunit ribosomal protein S23